MMFSSLSIFVFATLATSTVAAGVPQTCPNNGPVECCTRTRLAIASDKQLSSDIVVGTDTIWLDCIDLSVLTSQNKACNVQPVCCDKLASDRSIASKCTIAS